jgi:hypothetical protein
MAARILEPLVLFCASKMLSGTISRQRPAAGGSVRGVLGGKEARAAQIERLPRGGHVHLRGGGTGMAAMRRGEPIGIVDPRDPSGRARTQTHAHARTRAMDIDAHAHSRATHTTRTRDLSGRPLIVLYTGGPQIRARQG